MLVSKYGNHLDVELQQRATEYWAIFNKHDDMRCVDTWDSVSDFVSWQIKIIKNYCYKNQGVLCLW